MSRIEVSFSLNGEQMRVEGDGNCPLLYVLRNDLGCRTVRFGCGSGLCGACMVLMDGRPVASCDTPLWSADGTEILTVDGWQDDAPLRHLVDAVIAEQAAQCGYCLPGILMSARALMAQDTPPDRAGIAEALGRNLCRCGAQARILRAIDRAVSEARQ